MFKRIASQDLAIGTFFISLEIYELAGTGLIFHFNDVFLKRLFKKCISGKDLVELLSPSFLYICYSANENFSLNLRTKTSLN
jgi:hypothetical protein